MNKQRKTSHILNVFQYDADGHVVLPASLTLSIAPGIGDNDSKVPTTSWVRTYVTGLTYLTGNQSITVSGDATGSGTTSITLTLANTAVTPGTYGSATLVPVVTVDSKGRITSVTTAAISGSLTFTGDVTGTGTTGTSTALTLAASGVTAGTYTKVTVDTKGRVTGGANATTTDIAEGNNLYYTDTRARASNSFVAGSGGYNSTTGVITIPTNTNQLTNGAGYITGITSSNVTTALGFTPYNATNPSGYITGITSGNVTTALGYTPYNSLNPAGYITASSLSSYLPLSGGNMTGNLRLVSISGNDQMVENTYGAYLHLGGWAVGRTDASAVLVNTAYRADYADALFDMNISRFTNNSGYITSVSWSAVTGKPSNVMYYQGFTLNADTMDSNSTGFTYSVGAPYTGPVARFSTGGGYDLWLNATYGGGGTQIAYRTRNGDAGTLNPWYRLYSDTYRPYADRSQRANGNFYMDDNYGNQLIGVYTSTRYQGVFAMGDAYKLPADGSSPSNLYGLAWSHPNAGGVASNLNTHGLLVMENGTFLAAISGSIRARDDVRAPAMFVSGNAVIHAGNIGSQSVNYASSAGNSNTVGGYAVAVGGSANTIPTRNASGYLIPENWIQLNGHYGLYSGTNGAHFYPNNSSYGSWKVLGERNGWRGLHFGEGTGITLMMNEGEFGFHREAVGWVARFTSGHFHGYANSAGSISGQANSATINATSGNSANQIVLRDGAGDIAVGALNAAHVYLGSGGRGITAADTYGSYGNVMTIGTGINNWKGYGIYDNAGYMSYFMSQNGNYGIYAQSHGQWAFYYGTGTASYAIGSDSPVGGYTLYLIYGLYTVGLYNASDARMKKDIKPLSSSLDKVKLLRGVSYEYIDKGPDGSKNKGSELGFIAQEVLPIIPELIRYDDEKGYAMNYNGVSAVLVEAIKEQQIQIESQQLQIEELKTKLDNVLSSR